MDTSRAFVAIVLSFLILFGYQYFFVGTPPEQEQQVAEKFEQEKTPVVARKSEPIAGSSAVAAPAIDAIAAPAAIPARQGRDITLENDLFHAVITETGGGIKSFRLKKYMATTEPDSGFVELIKTESFKELPLFFSWGVDPAKAEIPLFAADRKKAVAESGAADSLTMKAKLASGLEITRTLSFEADKYLINMSVDVRNNSATAFSGSPYLAMTNQPVSESSASRYLFSGPALLLDDGLKEIKVDDIEEEPQTLKGKVSWAAYEETYFMTGIIPEEKDNQTVRLSAVGDKVSTLLTGIQETIPAQGHRQYNYSIYFGPKKLSVLEDVSADLGRIVDFGWFDKMAKPVLHLLNFFYRYIHNYGLAIIITTILIKLALWPITSKGMRSMKNMQAIQPKVAKIREKYKDDSNRMNQEMMNLYKTYKINPLGGCLPMLLQIPVFFALYKVLLQAIELRHAPFMLWITDLSAPDRLWIGLNIPYLGGLPVLTLLMGASMFLQQKMSPAPADPTQAKIMMFLPVIFTFMFLNFASGLVLYWFINNLLSIGQQYMVNRPVKA